MLQGSEDTATKIIVSSIGVIGTFCAALISVIGVIINILITRKNHKESLLLQSDLKDREAALAKEFKSVDVQLEVKRQLFQKELEAIRSSSEDENAAKSARREYEYEARQRLYQEIEPLLFQLAESSEYAFKRIRSIARTAREGDLEPGEGWLHTDGYYALSTMHKLMTPITTIKLIQRQLTAIDLSLDGRINELYRVAKNLFFSFAGDFDIAKLSEAKYSPNYAGDDMEEKQEKNPTEYRRQGLVQGVLEEAAEALIIRETNEARRCMSYGEFVEAYRADGSKVHRNFSYLFKTLFQNFHPKRMPILWNILITQVCLYEQLQQIYQNRVSDPDESPKSFATVKIPKADFDWRKPSDLESEVDGTSFQDQPIAQRYLRKHYRPDFEVKFE